MTNSRGIKYENNPSSQEYISPERRAYIDPVTSTDNGWNTPIGVLCRICTRDLREHYRGRPCLSDKLRNNDPDFNLPGTQ